MKTSLLVVISCVLAAAAHASKVCCPKTRMEWPALDCGPFPVSDDGTKQNSCEAKVCNDGLVHDGSHCGQGACDAAGCNCEGGCFEGNAAENFRRIFNIPEAVETLIEVHERNKRSDKYNPNRYAGAPGKIAKAVVKGYQQGQMYANEAQKQAERERKNLHTAPSSSTNYAKEASKSKRW